MLKYARNLSWLIVANLVLLWLVANQAPVIATDPPIFDLINSVEWEPNGQRILVVGRDETKTWGLWLYDADQNPTIIERFASLPSVHWQPQGRYFSSGNSIFDANTFQIVLEISAGSGIGGWSSDGVQVIAWQDGESNVLGLYDSNAGILLQSISVGDRNVVAVKWSPQGNYLALHQFDGTVDIIRALDGSLVITLPVNSPSALEWSNDEKYIGLAFTEYVEPTATATLLPHAANPTVASVAVLDTATGNFIHRMDGLLDLPKFIRWHPYRPEIAVGTNLGLIYILNSELGEQIDVISTIGPLSSISYSPFGGRLISGANTLNSRSIAYAAAERDNLFPDANDWMIPLESGSLAFVVPDPTVDRLQSIAQLCFAPGEVPTITYETLSDFVNYLATLPDGTIPEVCKDDLTMVGRAIQDQVVSPISS